MTRLLILTTAPRLKPLHLDRWLEGFDASTDVSVVAMTIPAGRFRLDVTRYVTVPTTRRPGSLPLEQPLRGSATDVPRPLTGGRVRRRIQLRYGPRIDAALERRGGDRLKATRSERFAAWCLKVPEVQEMFAAADVVVAMDDNSAWAAWQLARRIEGPAVIRGMAGVHTHLAGRAAD